MRDSLPSDIWTPREVAAERCGLDLQFLGSGNAFSAEGRAYSSFVVNQRYMFDAGPTVLPQLRQASMDPGEVETVFISHFHADHFFGLPFLFLDAWRKRRDKDLTIVGPPGIEERTEHLMELAFPGPPQAAESYCRRYVEVEDGACGALPGLEFRAVEVEHVPNLRCFGYAVRVGGRTVMYSGDARYCEGLLDLAEGADVLVLDCNCGGDPVHLSRKDVEHVRDIAGQGATTILSHLDSVPAAPDCDGVIVASDLARYRL